MATVNAPYPSEMDDINDASMSSMVREGNEITLLNRGEEVVGTFEVQDEDAFNFGTIVTVGAFDTEYRETLVKDWYRPVSPNVKIADPATLPTGLANDSAWSSDGVYLAVAHEVTPFVTIYKRVGDVLTKLANPATLPPGTGHGVSWSPGGNYLVVTHLTTPFITIYKRAGDVLTKLTDPQSLPLASAASKAMDSAWSSDSQFLAVTVYSSDVSKFLIVYYRSGDVFTKIADPAVMPIGTCYGVSWSPGGLYLAVACGPSGGGGATFLMIYKRFSYTLVHMNSAAPLPPEEIEPAYGLYGISQLDAAIIPGNGFDVSWSPNGQYLAFGHNGWPYLSVYKRSLNVFTKLPDVVSPPASAAKGVVWSPDGRYLAVAHDTTPFVTVYKFKDDIFTKLPNLATLPSDAFDVDWSPDGRYLSVSHNASPYISVYKSVMGPLGGPATRVELVP